jgi:hypothetical protein
LEDRLILYARYLIVGCGLWLFVANLGAAWAVERSFRVTANLPVEANGRLVVFLISETSAKLKNRQPVDGPFWDDPQPLFGIDATSSANYWIVNDESDCFPVKPSQIPLGRYRAQARMDLQRLNSDWRREPLNLWSEVVEFETTTSNVPQVIDLVLSNRVQVETPNQVEGVEWFAVRSELLSRFRGYEVFLRAGVVLPSNYDATKRYPAIYEVPGFGGDHTSAARGRRRAATGDANELANAAFRIVLDPEGPNGHSLFVDSANNGPCGESLTKELIPAIEAKYPLIASSTARVLKGHSSGGWSSLWLALQYPAVFGATWSSAPDPVDFRRFQKIDIYNQPNFYRAIGGDDLPSLRSRGKVQMTVRQESRGEDVLGPDNCSGQQWDSWFAAFGPKNALGNPAALFDPLTGTIDPSVVEHYCGFDICCRLRNDPGTYLPLFRNHVRLVCGTEDSFYLNEAVALLDAEVNSQGRQPSDPGYIKLVPGDHGSVMSSEAMKAIPFEMLVHFRAHGHIPPKK